MNDRMQRQLGRMQLSELRALSRAVGEEAAKRFEAVPTLRVKGEAARRELDCLAGVVPDGPGADGPTALELLLEDD